MTTAQSQDTLVLPEVSSLTDPEQPLENRLFSEVDQQFFELFGYQTNKLNGW